MKYLGSISTLMLFVLLCAGCTVGPKYKQPDVKPPDIYRGAEQSAPAAGTPAFGDQKWWDAFQDETLQELIRTALKQNYDVRIAATRITEARLQLGITRADQLPTAAASAGATVERNAQSKFIPSFDTSNGTI